MSDEKTGRQKSLSWEVKIQAIKDVLGVDCKKKNKGKCELCNDKTKKSCWLKVKYKMKGEIDELLKKYKPPEYKKPEEKEKGLKEQNQLKESTEKKKEGDTVMKENPKKIEQKIIEIPKDELLPGTGKGDIKPIIEPEPSIAPVVSIPPVSKNQPEPKIKIKKKKIITIGGIIKAIPDIEEE